MEHLTAEEITNIEIYLDQAYCNFCQNIGIIPHYPNGIAPTGFNNITDLYNEYSALIDISKQIHMMNNIPSNKKRKVDFNDNNQLSKRR